MADKSLNLGTLFTADPSQFFQTISRMKESLKTLNSAYAQTGRAAKSGMSGISTSVDKTNKSFDKGGQKAQEYSKQIGKVEGAFKRIMAAMKVTASYGIAATAIFAVTNAFKAGVKEIIDYDQALKNLQAITRATDAEVVGMGEAIKHVAETTKFSTSEVADGMVLLGQAGFTATEGMNAMQAVANLATGTLGSMTTVTDLLTTTIRAFNLDTIESSRVADVMANAINRSKLTIDKLRIAFNFVGAAAAQSGLGIEELSASMMLLANNGLRASTIGTGLRQVLARLLAPNRRLREEFQAQGIELDKINPKTVGYQAAMKELTKVLYDAETKTVDMGKAYQLFGLRGAQAVAVLVKGFAGSGFQNMLDKTYEVGTAATMAEKQMEGLGVAFKNLMDRAKLIAVTLGEGGIANSLRILVQALKGVTIAVQIFLRSGLGQLLISMGSVTGAAYLLSKAFVFLGARALFLTKIFTGTKLVMGVLISEFIGMNRAIGFSAAVSGTLGTVFSRLYGIMAAHPFLAIAVALGVVIGAINHYLGRTQRAIDATVKMTQESKSHVHTLKVYSDILNVLSEKKKKGINIDNEYLTVLKRLKVAYPDLKKEIELSTEAFEKNSEAVKNALGKELQKNIEESTRLVKLYTKAAEEARIKAGLLESVSTAIKSMATVVGDFITGVGKIWGWLFNFMGDLASRIPIFGGLISGILKDIGYTFNDLIGNSKKYFSELGKDSKEAIEIEKKRLDRFKETSETMKKAGKSAKEVTKVLKEMGATSEDIEKVNLAVEGQVESLEELEARYKGTLKDVPNMFKDFYEKLDDQRKANFTKTVKAMDDEIAAFKKKEKEISGTSEKRYGVEAAIKAKHLLKFVEDNYKEILSAEELSKKKIEILNVLSNVVRAHYDEQTKIVQNTYQKEYILAQENKDKLLAAENKFNLGIEYATKQRNQSLVEIQKAHNERIKKEQVKLVEEINKLNIKMAKDMIKQLQSKYDKLKSEAKKLMDELKSLEETYNDAMRESKQKTMTEEEKWYDDRKELDRLMNEARTTNDLETWKEALQLAKSLGREVTDENGKVIKGMEETTKTSQNLMTKIYDAQVKLVDKGLKAVESQMYLIKEDLKDLKKLLDEYTAAIGTASEKELKLEMEKTLKSLQEAHGLISGFASMWGNLRSKEITLTVKVDDQSGGAFNTGPSDAKDAPAEKKKGGFIERLARGRKLPGFGGGDKIRALLEAGEWVIKKEAVNKYGSALFEALNNMSFNIEDLLGGAMKRMGGMIAQPAVAKYQSGGEVGSGGSVRAGNTYQITFAPQFMTGDAMAMRNMAPELKRILEDLDHRWGR